MLSDPPQFTDKIPIQVTPSITTRNTGRSWTARFDSVDERKIDLYYIVTIYEGDQLTSQFYVCIFPWWSFENWNDPIYCSHLQDAIHAVAITGQTNTNYQGSLFGWHPSK